MAPVFVADGWTVRITRTDKSSFIAFGDREHGVLGCCFFVRFREAHAYKRELRERGMDAQVVRARVNVQAE